MSVGRVSVGRVGGSGTVLVLFWHCPGTGSGTGSSTVMALPCPSLACKASRICTRPTWCSARTLVPPCHPATPGTPPAPPAPAVRPRGIALSVHGVWEACGAHSGLYPWTDCLLMCPGPLHWPHLPADRHPMFATERHPGSALTV